MLNPSDFFNYLPFLLLIVLLLSLVQPNLQLITSIFSIFIWPQILLILWEELKRMYSCH